MVLSILENQILKILSGSKSKSEREIITRGYLRENLRAIERGVPDSSAEIRQNELQLAARAKELNETLKLFSPLPEDSYYIRPSRQEALFSSTKRLKQVLTWVDNQDILFKLFHRLYEDGHRFDQRNLPSGNLMFENVEGLVSLAHDSEAVVDLANSLERREGFGFGLYEITRNEGVNSVKNIQTFIEHQEELFPFIDELLSVSDIPDHMRRCRNTNFHNDVDALLALLGQRENVLNLQRKLNESFGTSFDFYQLLVRDRREGDEKTEPQILAYAQHPEEVVGFFQAVKRAYPSTNLNKSCHEYSLGFEDLFKVRTEEALRIMEKHKEAGKLMAGFAALGGYILPFKEMVRNKCFASLLEHADNFQEICKEATKIPADTVPWDDGGAIPERVPPYWSLTGNLGLLTYTSRGPFKYSSPSDGYFPELLVEAVRKGPSYAENVLADLCYSGRITSMWPIDRLGAIARSILVAKNEAADW